MQGHSICLRVYITEMSCIETKVGYWGPSLNSMEVFELRMSLPKNGGIVVGVEIRGILRR